MKLEIKISKKPIEYKKAIRFLEERVIKIQNKESGNLLWILEHPNLYSAGTSAKDKDLLNKNKFPVYKTNRGGQWTFHGDGQKIVYFAIDLASEKNLKKFVRKIENWIIKILNNYKIESSNDPDNIGIWVNNNNNLEKIAAIGIRVKKWVAFHGFALNINVDKKNYNGIIPCGIKDKGIANMSDLIDLSNLENINEIIILEFKKTFPNIF
ncbi:MAG: lipoyl(octanoyl) transferase LipB [Pseudomonadota bacterium]|nr:lipoyl(octanoyl) transferase LipB [Pseudomonadota bacterium]